MTISSQNYIFENVRINYAIKYNLKP